MAVADIMTLAFALPLMYVGGYQLAKYVLQQHSGDLMTLAVQAMPSFGAKEFVWSTVAFSWALTLLSFHPVLWYTAWVCPGGKLDNKNPRQQKEELTGFGARMWAGHKNAHEAFPGFLGGVCCCVAFDVPYSSIAPACLLFTAARLAFHVMYALNIDMLRSFSFILGVELNALLFFRAIAPSVFPWFV